MVSSRELVIITFTSTGTTRGLRFLPSPLSLVILHILLLMFIEEE
jgi:hypothetical protein